MTEERDIEEIVATLETELHRFSDPLVSALIADWRAKKAEIERLYRDLGSLISAHGEAILQLEYLHGRFPTGTGEAVLTRLRQDHPPPPQSTSCPAGSQDGQA